MSTPSTPTTGPHPHGDCPLSTGLGALDPHLAAHLRPGNLVVVADADYVPGSRFARQLANALAAHAPVRNLVLSSRKTRVSVLEVAEVIEREKNRLGLNAAVVHIDSFELITCPTLDTFAAYASASLAVGGLPLPPINDDLHGGWRAQLLKHIAQEHNVLIIVGLDRTDLTVPPTHTSLVTPKPWLASMPRPTNRGESLIAEAADVVLMPWHHGTAGAVLGVKSPDGPFEVTTNYLNGRYID